MLRLLRWPVLAAVVEKINGRIWMPESGFQLWNGDISSNLNSQCLFDPYSFTHIIHGFLWYLLIPYLPVRLASPLETAILLESIWEMIENSSWIIDKYRKTAINQGYYGDSILNSMGDILSMAAGYYIASTWLGSPLAVILAAAMIDLTLYWTIGDSFTQNVIELL